ncbi:anti-sigma factor antagonist [Evansella cellulosilytica]|uniref:Anti-sigma factor antagonist n=1 Tax=Evansella cellulosilytica (strain ATCC 21833 / DSM 2522 / FERM P-1141 / JCM 9156 / N-4) TaxID=649639 RepID=E6TV49_EVAC2|nr:anti-sigma factor antagonist [Evansella cellulosilytica]ADU28632.1 anti-sigma-factor antagonist [Evansella cellulosilytica DSM 2522]
MNLQVDVKDKGQAKTVHLNGEVDVYTADSLKKVLLPLAEKNNETIVVDLSNVNYIDSTGLGIFIGALKATNKSGSQFKITGVNARIKRLFSITGLDEVIDIDADQREGV